ncbi:hypothetical protein U1Q18_038940 [Sarracenia purpurea var. burkii]
MAGAEEQRGTTNNVNPQTNSHPRDLLRRFIPVNHFPRKFEETIEKEEEDIELSLGLSLNGRFGVDPKREKTLTRASSISDFTLTDDRGNGAFMGPPAAAYASPMRRTCSLPTETEEEWRKRKEVQSLRRMEAKRKRLDKLKNSRVGRDQACVEANGGENYQAPIQGSVACVAGQGISESSGGGGAEVVPSQLSSQGSIGSRGSGSSGISESWSQPTQAMNGCTEARSPTSVQSLPNQNEQKPIITARMATKKPAKFVENPSAKLTVSDNETKEMMKNMMVEMPCVSTRGVGPNGRRTEGFLYRYRKGEEVRIVCVCHGSFLSPAEFVKHAGGGEVAHPLKHIVVNPSPFL